MRDMFNGDSLDNACGGFGFTRRGAELFLTLMKDQLNTDHQISELLSFFFIEHNGVLYLREMFYIATATRIEPPREARWKYEVYKAWIDEVRNGVDRILHPDLGEYQALSIKPRSVQRFIQNLCRLSSKKYLASDFLSYQLENLSLELSNIFYQSVAKSLGLTINILVFNPRDYDDQYKLSNSIFSTTSSTVHKSIKKAAKGETCVILCHNIVSTTSGTNVVVIKGNVVLMSAATQTRTKTLPNYRYDVRAEHLEPLLIQYFEKNGLKIIRHEEMQVGGFINLWSPSEIVQNSAKNDEFPAFTFPKLLAQLMYSNGEKFLPFTNMPAGFMPGIPLRILEKLSWFAQVQKVLLLYPIALIVGEYSGITQSFQNFRGLLNSASLLKTPKQCEITVPYGYRDVPRNGHCFYYAIAEQIGITAEELHRMAVAELLEHPERYEGFALGGGLDIMIMDEAQEGSRVWAGHVMMQAAANALGRTLIVNLFNLDGTPTGEAPITINPIANSDGSIIIGNIGNAHFVAPDPAVHGNTEEYGPGNAEEQCAVPNAPPTAFPPPAPFNLDRYESGGFNVEGVNCEENVGGVIGHIGEDAP